MTSNRYPFTTKRAIIQRLAIDPQFVRDCMRLLYSAHQNRANQSGPSGFSSSHRALGLRLCEYLAIESCTPDQIGDGAKLAAHYSAQLSRIFRAIELKSDPSLKALGAIYGVVGKPD